MTTPHLALRAMFCSHRPRHRWSSLPPRHTAGPGSARCPPASRAIPQSCSSAPPAPACVTAGLCLSSAGLHICPCWVSSGPSWSILTTCPGTSEWQPCLPPYQLVAPHLLSSPNLMRMPFIHSSEMLNRTGPMIDHCRTTLGTGLQVGYDPLTMTLWARPFFLPVFYPCSCPPIQMVIS